jgi:pimeloyl-ACP methyl ester carboxylesterase
MAAVVFIHGFQKRYDDWDTTDRGRNIGIADKISERFPVVCVQLSDEDYCKSFSDVAKEISTAISQALGEKRIIIVAHSLGCVYAMLLAQLDSRRFNKLLLVEPTIQSELYRQQLLEKVALDVEDLISASKLKHFHELPSSLPNRVVVRIHFNYAEHTTAARVGALHELVKNNAKSRLVLHYDASHMIHYKLPEMVISSILELCSVQ